MAKNLPVLTASVPYDVATLGLSKKMHSDFVGVSPGTMAEVDESLIRIGASGPWVLPKLKVYLDIRDHYKKEAPSFSFEFKQLNSPIRTMGVRYSTNWQGIEADFTNISTANIYIDQSFPLYPGDSGLPLVTKLENGKYAVVALTQGKFSPNPGLGGNPAYSTSVYVPLTRFHEIKSYYAKQTIEQPRAGR